MEAKRTLKTLKKRLLWLAVLLGVGLGTSGVLAELFTASVPGTVLSLSPGVSFVNNPPFQPLQTMQPFAPSQRPAIFHLPPTKSEPFQPLQPQNDSGVLDQRRQLALGMIETGNNDRRIGGAGEVSRYQIMPSVWKHYSDSHAYQDQETALEVARQHWSALHAEFKHQTGREPTDFDMYVLWNTHHGYYAARKFTPARLAPVVRDRAQRFVNLVVASGRDA